MAAPVSRVLSSSQLATLAEHGEERTAEVGETLFEIGDKSYPFIAIIEGEVAVTRRGGPGDHPPRRLGLPRRDQPALRADGVPDRGRHRADALHRGRSRGAQTAAVRRRLAVGPAAVGVRRAARDAPAPRGRRLRDHRPARLARHARAWSTSPGACGSRTPGSCQTRTRRRRRWSRVSTPRDPARAAAGRRSSCAGRATASSPGRSGSAASSRSARRSTC